MTERRRSKAEERAYAALRPALAELNALEALIRREYEKQLEALPTAWGAVEAEVPVRPVKVRIIATYDADVARFFRGLGHGYQARMNAVLRAYMLAVQARVVRNRRNEDWLGNEI